ncbi:carbon-monoxide dehydrogenase large subunit [Thermomonospora echinospora]|uniref:Carbon-monoxide dehydrogenase large subunit n=1 Tax=Thermomonospora echinospora TaxID=1992 RepID=A0A1H6E2V0_9ACTN|nr:xanthine dehydrogenase family protein molybdopterin-binding subunit [Thermomonospora echinospora]SEG91950.1 carbon-monoxide dehydrogenase large subunit [Thermomonospora echinospora]
MNRLVGARVPRLNDPRLLSGQGTYIDDISLPGMLHAVMVRSSIAHGRVERLEVDEALADEDVHAVITLDQAMARLGELPLVWLAPGQRHTAVPVVSREVRYVGQPLGVVVADSRAAAEDALDLVDIGYEELDAVVDAEEALADGAPLLYPEWGTNVVASYSIGDTGEEIEQVFAGAAHVVERRLRVQRLAVNPIEPRGVVARWDAGLETLTVWTSTQVSHHVRDHLAVVLGLRTDQVRVIARDVGGGFGAKEHLYADEALTCLAAMITGRPVKWIEDRGEHFGATFHARDVVHRARLATDADGRFLAIHSDIVGNCGAHASNVGTGPFRISSIMLPGPYRFERAGTTITGVVTTTTPTGAMRGFGMQEASWVRERLVDEAARELGMDPVELRLRNMLEPGDLPYETRTHQRYDSGDYPEALHRVAVEIDKRARPSQGRIRRGIGVATHVEFTGLGPSSTQQLVGFHLGGYETGVVRVEPDGSVLVTSGVVGMGQGIETTLAQLAAEQLRVPMSAVRVQLGDTATAPYSASGSIASRSMVVGGGAVVRAGARLHERLVRIAAHRLEAAPGDIEVEEGVFSVKGVPDSSLTLADIAGRAWLGWDLPEGERADLEEKDVHDPENVSYSYAAHAAAVAVDLDTGQVRIEDYWLVHDAGTVVNPMIADGQVIGGVAHGMGIALHEEMRYDPSGQPITTSYLDYVMPTAEDVPDMDVAHMCTPAPHIPGGMKGLGEGGTILSPVTVGNAVAAAVPEIAERLVETPLSPSRMWTLIHEAGLHDDPTTKE